MLRKLWPLGVITLLTIIFFWKVIFQGLVAFPGDLLVGSYYPWLSHKWGYEVGVPVKNPLISDVFSQFYIWKSLIINSFKQFQIPLWNPYSYSGYPLLANLHSGAFNPLNAFLFLNPFTTGWNLMVIAGIFISAVSMYFFLRSEGCQTKSSLIGSISYAFSGCVIVWMEFAIISLVMAWLPLLLLLVKKYYLTSRIKYIVVLATVYFCVITVGHFQTWAYASLLTASYAVYLKFKYHYPWRKMLLLGIGLGLGILLSAIQLIPAWELFNLSIRNNENYIANINYGLLPPQNLITAWSPDFFGNPTTGNNWGFFNYIETQFYTGIVGVVTFIFVLLNFRLFKHQIFWITLTSLALLMAFNNPISQLIYQLHVPGLSTSSAGRISVLYTFGISVLIANFVDKVKSFQIGKLLKPIFISLIIVVCAVGLMLLLNLGADKTQIAIRNSVLPALLIAGLGVILIFKKSALFEWAILFLIVADLFHFGWKFTPFVKPELVFPQEEFISWFTHQPGTYRIERESGPLLPPNTWAYYGLSAASGYDPAAYAAYVRVFTTTLNQSLSVLSRYSELSRYDAKTLGEFNVKYLLALKRDNHEIIDQDWTIVKDSPTVVILENKYWQPRARLEKQGSAEIVSYLPNLVTINYGTSQPNILILADTWYPGWKALVNNKEVEVKKTAPIFRSVDVPQGSGTVLFYYDPSSFRWGVYISAATLLILVFLVLAFPTAGCK